MKKGILCILLSLILLVPTLVSCQQEADFTGTEASIYTLYTIVDESTTDEAIHEVELALNRILFYRLGVILKLEMVTEDEYDKLIEDKFIEMEEYQLAKKNKNKDKSESSVSSEEVSEEDIMTGDKILDLLEEGKDIPLEEPRLDIFLVRGYDDYYELATNGKLADLDVTLNNEAKALKSSIHSTLFTAAQVNGKTYGVPVNNAIGEYTYLVFDKELLDQHGIDPNTLKSVEDLQDYLQTIKENNPDVIPLKNAKESTDISFLSNEGFPALINNGEVIDAYNNSKFKNYFAMIARYEALGYLSDSVVSEAEATDDARYAVRIETGNIDSIEAKLADTGYEYEYSLYSAPLATNETTIDNIFCISEYVVSSELTEVMKIVTAINTDAQLMNLLTYGVENEHYTLDDNGQVERRKDNPESVYIIDPNHVGNCFITYTLKGENPEKWNNDIKQNQDAIVSPSLGFTSSLYEFKYKETVEIEDPDNPEKILTEETEISVYEPDYVEIINSVVDKYYPALLSGTAVEFDYDTLLNQATEEITAEFIERLDELYENDILKPMFVERMREQITKSRGPEIYAEAEADITEAYYNRVESNLKNKLTSEYKEQNPDKTSSEISEMVSEVLTDEYIEEHFTDYFTYEELEEMIQETYQDNLEYEIENAIDDIADSAEYNREFAKLKSSDGYKQKLNDMLAYDAPRKIQNRVDELIAEYLIEYTDNMITEMDTAIETAVNTFIEENSEILGLTREEMLEKMGYLSVDDGEQTEGEEGTETSAEESTEESTEEGEDGESNVEYKENYESWYEFAFEEKIAKVYYELYPLGTN